MVSCLITASVPPEDREFLDKNPQLSPSKMLQSKIKEIRDFQTAFEKENAQLRAHGARIQRQIDDLNEFLRVKGLEEEFWGKK